MSTTDPAQPNDHRAITEHFILGTAGHIDHGKTLLVEALTGTNTDRLPEEKRRGMTIELGFAELVIGNICFGVVDVPGHERFVRTMVAGASGIDLALIIVAADDSVMPQTREHVDILNLLGIRHAVVAVTKIDLVDDEMVELVVEEVKELLAGTALAAAPICPVSAVSGAGVDELRQTITTTAASLQPRPSARPFRMDVDRVFTVPGRGTVVTGSALRGSVEVGETLEVWPAAATCRVRTLQTHGAEHNSLGRGQRCAINVSNVDRANIQRGSELVTPGYLQPSPMIDVRLRCLPSCGRPLKSASIIRLGIGTVELPVRVVLLDGASRLDPGETAFAQFRSGTPLTTTYRQPFIIRDETAVRTIGGGFVLRPVARRKRRRLESELESLQILESGAPIDRVEQVLRAAGFIPVSDLQVCARAGVELDTIPKIIAQLKDEKRWIRMKGTDVFAVPQAADDLAQRLRAWLERYHRGHPELPGRHVDSVLGWLERMTNRPLAKSLFETFVESKTLKLIGKFACLPAFAPELSNADEKLLAEMVEEIRAGGFQPPALEAIKNAPKGDRKRMERLATLAVALGELIQVAPKLYLHAEVERDLRKRVTQMIGQHGGVSVSLVRETLDSSRKYVIPFMEYLDRIGFTKRLDDLRILADTPSENEQS